MADDKAKIDWKMLETAAAEPAPPEEMPFEPAPAEPAGLTEAAAPAATPAAAKIVFYCSNGHRIVVASKMGGQRGKCSKCGVAVRIPTSSQPLSAARRVAGTQTGGAAAHAAVEPPAAEEAAPAIAADERFTGGDASQQAPDQEDEQAVGHAAPHEDMFSGLATASDSQVSATEFAGFSAQASQSGVARPEPAHAVPDGLVNPTAALVARLFQEIEHGGIVEVHIAGGSVILPEFYEPRWSVGSHGLFASRAADDTVTLTAVAWDSIQKIIVRQVNGLPDGMFE